MFKERLLKGKDLWTVLSNRNLYHNRNLKTSKVSLESETQATNLSTSITSNQRDWPKDSLQEALVKLPEELANWQNVLV